jgi:hypothetical protein
VVLVSMGDSDVFDVRGSNAEHVEFARQCFRPPLRLNFVVVSVAETPGR